MGDMYCTGHEMTHPLSSGFMFGDLSYEQLRAMTTDLTQEECSAPSARHYDEPMAQLPPEHKAAVGASPLAPEDCWMPQELGRPLLTCDPKIEENGYGVLSNGMGYAAIKICQDGVTDEMIRAYREEFAHDGPLTLFYKIWFPGAHLLHYENGVVENFGWGMLNLEMVPSFLFEHLGIKEADIPALDPDCLCLLGLCGRGWLLEDPEQEPVYTCMVQHTRQTARGRELRVFYWSGCLFKSDVTLEIHLQPDREKTLRQMRMMMEHCMREYANEGRLMRQHWKNRQ